jgi:hypothetical protein
MKIDARTGQVTLPDGFVFDSTLTQTDFESQKLHDPAQVKSPGTPWTYFPFSAGEIEGHPLSATLCFYHDKLVSFSFQIELTPPGPKSWDNFSFEVEERMQKLHAGLFQGWFGKPHRITKMGSVDKEFPALGKVLHYNFGWGSAYCGYDERSGGTEASLRFLPNDEWAREDNARR